MHRCHPLFVCFVGDYPEQVLATGVKTMQCPNCDVPLDELGLAAGAANYQPRNLDAVLSYPIHSRLSSEVPDDRSNQIRSTDLYRIRHDKLLHSYPVHITLNTAYFLHLVYPPFRFIGYAFFRLCSTDPFHL